MRRIHVRRIDRVETLALPGTEGALHPFWSPDSRSLAFNTGAAHLKRIDVNGGTATDLIETRAPWHGTWNQFGDILFTHGGGVDRIPAAGGPTTRVVSFDGLAGSGTGHPFFLEDGKRFLIYMTGEKGSIQLASLGSTKRTIVLDDVESAPILAPTPQGKTYLLYLRESDLYGQELDERSGTLRGKPVLVVSNIGRVANPAVRAAVGVSPSGILAYQIGAGSQAGQLTWFDRSGTRVETLLADASGSAPELSPDGSSVAFFRSNASGVQNIWVTDLTRKSPRRLTFGSGRDVNVVWSPNSKRLAYMRVGGKDNGVHIIDLQDSSKDQLITGSQGSSYGQNTRTARE